MRSILDATDIEFCKTLEELNQYAFINYTMLSRHGIAIDKLSAEHTRINRTASIILALLLDSTLYARLNPDNILRHLIDAGFSRWRHSDNTYSFLPADQENITLTIMSVAQLYGSSIGIL